MNYLGDFAEDATVYCYFSSNDKNGGRIAFSAETLAAADFRVYKDGGTTESTAGITVAQTFDSMVGMHKVEVDTSADAFYAIGSDYTLVLYPDETVDSESVAAIVATWSIENRYNDVNVTQIGGQTAAAAGGTVTFIGGATVATTTNITSGTIGLTDNAITAAKIATDAAPELRGSVISSTATTGGTTTLADTSLTQADDYWNGMYVLFTTGAAIGQVRLITDFANTGGVITYTPATATTSTDTYEILPAAAFADVRQWLGNTVSSGVNGVPDVDVTFWQQQPVPASTVNGYPMVELTHVNGVTTDVATLATDVDDIHTRLGTPIDFGSGTSTLAANLQDIADDGTAVYDRTTDSLQAVRDQVTAGVNAYTQGTYSGARVYIDADGISGTGAGTGTDSIPHDGVDLTEAITLAGTAGTKTLFSQPGVTLTLAETTTLNNFILDGDNWTLVQGTSQGGNSMIIRNATITSGTTPAGTGNVWQLCTIGTTQLPKGLSTNGCVLDGTALIQTGSIEPMEWFDLIGSGGTLDCNSEAVTQIDLHMQGGKITINDVDAVTTLNIYGAGDITFTGTEQASTINIYGDFKITDSVGGGLSNLNYPELTNILTQANAALDTAISELSQEVPAATPTMRTGLMLLYMALRNKTDVKTTGTDALEIHADDGTMIAQKVLADDGTDYSEAKMISGV